MIETRLDRSGVERMIVYSKERYEHFQALANKTLESVVRYENMLAEMDKNEQSTHSSNS